MSCTLKYLNNIKEGICMDDDKTEQIYFSGMRKIKLLTKEEEIKLAHRIKKGDEVARKKFIEANLRLVVRIATPFSFNDKALKKDLIQEGNIGLIIAVGRFDPEREYKFSSFASWYIRGAILDYLNRNGFMTLPEKQKTKVNRMLKIARENGIVDLYTKEAIIRLTEGFNRRYPKKEGEEYTKRDIEKIISDYNLMFPICLDSAKSNDDDKTLSNYTEDTKAENPQNVTNEAIMHTKVMDLIRELSEVEQDVVIRRFGLDGIKFDTLEKIGKRKGLTRERIRQIEAKAVRKLRSIMFHLHEEIK